jgi:cytochrome c556
MPGKLFLSLCSAVVVASSIATIAAEPKTPAEMQKARHEHYEELGDAFKAVRDQSKASPPDFAALEKAAQTVYQASINQQQWFPKGTGPEAGKTRALPEIWTKPDEFAAAQKLLADRAPKLLAVAKTHDVAAITAAFREVGGACKNCHDTFRSPEE